MQSWLLLWVFLGLQVQSDGRQTRLAMVRGKVVADTGIPVVRASVELRPVNFVPGPHLLAFTDSSGVYEIHKVVPGTYNAHASKPGFVDTSLDRGNDSPYLTVQEGEDAKNVDFVLSRTSAIYGTVLDEHDEPLAHAVVWAMVKTYTPSMHWDTRASATTDDRGQYRVYGLPPGRYYLQAIRRNTWGRPSQHYAPALYPGVSRVADAQAIKLGVGEELSGIKFQLHESAAFTVSGKVVDLRTGKAPAGTVRLDPEDDNWRGMGSFVAIRGDGTFRFTEVVPGSYRVSVGLDIKQGGLNTSRALDVIDRDINNLSFAISKGATIKGRVIRAGGGDPPPMQVRLRSEGGSDPDAVPIRDDGSFEIPGLQPATYEIANVWRSPQEGGGMASYDHPPGVFFVSAIAVNHQDSTDTGIVVPEGASSLEVTVTLDDHAGTITGTVFDADNHPLTDVGLALFSADPKKRHSERYFRQDVSGFKGRFSLKGLVPGDYMLVPWPGKDPGVVTDPEVFALVEKYCLRVSVTAAGSANQDLHVDAELQRIAESIGQK